jgi:predicted Zn-dependent protease
MYQIKILIFVLISIILIGCSTVPMTGRQQLNLVSQSTMLSMSFQQYNEFLQENSLSDNAAQSQMVTRVGKRIQKAVEEYFSANKMSHELSSYSWEFHLIESEEVNAWCMPGGKVVIYTGILPITRDETGLAVVMGHEIAHAIAKHGNERMSQGLLAQAGGMALSTALESEPETTRQLWMAAYGLGAQIGIIMPYSRLHENEADHLGLIFMSMAGYNPNEAVGFWQRMAAKKGGEAPPEFLSTHPSNQTRINNLRDYLPTAIVMAKKYNDQQLPDSK